MRRQHRRDAAVRRVHVHPQSLARAEVGDGRHRIDACRRRRPDRGHDGNRQHPVRAILADRVRERVDAHAEAIVGRDLAQGLEAEADRDDGLVDGRMRLVRTVNAHAGHVAPPGQALRANVVDGDFARRDDCVHRRDRRRVVDDAFERVGQTDQPSQPTERDGFELSRGGRRAPQHRLLIECGRQKVGQDAGRVQWVRPGTSTRSKSFMMASNGSPCSGA